MFSFSCNVIFVQNFVVTGKCIGQDTFNCQQVYADKVDL